MEQGSRTRSDASDLSLSTQPHNHFLSCSGIISRMRVQAGNGTSYYLEVSETRRRYIITKQPCRQWITVASVFGPNGRLGHGLRTHLLLESYYCFLCTNKKWCIVLNWWPQANHALSRNSIFFGKKEHREVVGVEMSCTEQRFGRGERLKSITLQGKKKKVCSIL